MITEDEPSGTVETTTTRRKPAAVKKFGSLQVSHYPALLMAGDPSSQSEAQAGVIWKTSSNNDTPSPELQQLNSAAASPTTEQPIPPCSPSLLLPPERMSFNQLVNATMRNNSAGRCLSSASPMSSADRKEIFGAGSHSLDRGSQSVESLSNSCNDLQMYRQQRKRRTGISSGSTARDAFACGGGNGINSAGGARGSALSGRSPQSSFDSNQDVAQISMNLMRMNGLAQGPVRPILTGNPPKASHSSTHLSRLGSLRKMNAVATSLDDRVTHHTTNANHYDYPPEITALNEASRKSVSIAYSNDLEAQKNGAEDSETPLMEEKEDGSGGRLIKREMLHERRRVVCDRALAFAIAGIVLMVFENELRAGGLIHVGSLWSLSLKAMIFISTCILLVFASWFHIIEVQLFMNANAADDWRVSLTARRVAQIVAELLVCSLCPLPLELGQWARQKTLAKQMHSINVFLSIAMFFRLYWLCRVMLLHSRLFTDASSRSIAGLNRVNFNARFILKTLMTLCPGTMLMIFTASLWIMAGWILRLCEREYITVDRQKDIDYVGSIWLVAITFLSIGYGDIVPHTNCGRTMAVITGILGTCTSSMVVAVIARKLELTRAEKHVHNFMMDTQLTKQLKHSAANVLRETWLIYKFRKLVEKPDYARIRQHQRKFLVAIYELRKVKRDQRKLAENLVSLGDVAKTSSNTYELVQDVQSTQEGLSLRITAIEHQLGDISRELGSLVELLRDSRSARSPSEDCPTMVRRRRGDALLD